MTPHRDRVGQERQHREEQLVRSEVVLLDEAMEGRQEEVARRQESRLESGAATLTAQRVERDRAEAQQKRLEIEQGVNRPARGVGERVEREHRLHVVPYAFVEDGGAREPALRGIPHRLVDRGDVLAGLRVPDLVHGDHPAPAREREQEDEPGQRERSGPVRGARRGSRRARRPRS